MSTEHGTWQAYNNGCRCEDCIAAWRRYDNDKRAERALRISAIPHGTYAGYSSYMCRCRKCGEANRAWGASRLAALGTDKHGTATAYRHGCRCDHCKTENTLRSRAYTLKARARKTA